jgi:AbrB family looped-hinge helix DNA binding protein
MVHVEATEHDPPRGNGGFEAALRRHIRAKIDDGGRIVIPAEFRRLLGWRPGDSVLLSLGDQDIQIMTIAESIRRVQDWARSALPAGRSLSEELIAERRAEAARE